MNMRKKLMVTLMAAVLTVSSAATVFAAGSRTSDVTTNDPHYIVTPEIQKTEAFKTVEAEAPKAAEAITEVNKGAEMPAFAEALKEMLPEMTEEAKASTEKAIAATEGKDFVGAFFDLIAEDGVQKNEAGHYETTLSVPSMTEETEGLQALHYSTVRDLWEVLDPKNVDKKAKTATFEFEDLSPVILIANAGTFDKDQIQGTSPATEGTSVWMIWGALAIAFVAAGSVVLRKRA